MVEYIFNGVFNGNISVAGKTHSRETAFVQKLDINNFFGELKTFKCISYIKLSKKG